MIFRPSRKATISFSAPPDKGRLVSLAVRQVTLHDLNETDSLSVRSKSDAAVVNICGGSCAGGCGAPSSGPPCGRVFWSCNDKSSMSPQVSRLLSHVLGCLAIIQLLGTMSVYCDYHRVYDDCVAAAYAWIEYGDYGIILKPGTPPMAILGEVIDHEPTR